MEMLSYFSGYQVTRKAANDLRNLVTESKWRKLQKHFSVSLYFNCCRCDLTLSDLDELYEHFSTDHQVDLSYIETLLQESTKKVDEAAIETVELSEKIIKDLLHLGTNNGTDEEENTGNNSTDGIEQFPQLTSPKDNEVKSPIVDVLDDTNVPSKRKGRPRKRPLSDKQQAVDESNKQEETVKASPHKKKTNKHKVVEVKDKEVVKSVVKKRHVQTKDVKHEPTIRKSPRKSSFSVNLEMTDTNLHLKDENEDTIEIDLPTVVEKRVDITVPDGSLIKKDNKKRASGRDLESEEIKSKTCAICKEMQASIKDCFKHYEIAHNFVPKSVYEKPPVDHKFEQNKTRRGTSSRGRTRTDNNAEQCRFCGKMFLKSNIDKHIHLRHYWLRIERKEQRRQTVMCHLCGKVYHHTQNLEAHIAAVHRGTTRPRKKTNKSTSKPRVHICQNCGYTTPEIRRLKNHIAAHHEGVMPYQCDKCSFKTWEPSSWRCHKQRHSTEKKYKCTKCNYQCIQRKQLRRHMSVKHNVVLPKIWKRREDAAFTNPHSNKFLQDDPEYRSIKLKQIQINRHQRSTTAQDMADEDSVLDNPVSFGILPQGEIQLEDASSAVVQGAPTVEISSLQQPDISSLVSGSAIPPEIVITVANSLKYQGKGITSVGKKALGAEELPNIYSTQDLPVLRAVSASGKKGNPVVIPSTLPNSTTPNLRAALQEPPLDSTDNVKYAHPELIVRILDMENESRIDAENAIDDSIGTGRRYYKQDFALLKDIIQNRPNGPIIRRRKDGTLSSVQNSAHVSKEESSTVGSIFGYAGEGSTVYAAGRNGQDAKSNPTVQPIAAGDQHIVVFDTGARQQSTDVGSSAMTIENEAVVSTIDISQAATLTQFFPHSEQRQDAVKGDKGSDTVGGQGNYTVQDISNADHIEVVTTSSSAASLPPKVWSRGLGERLQEAAQSSQGANQDSNLTPLEQDIARTLIQINPLSHRHLQK